MIRLQLLLQPEFAKEVEIDAPLTERRYEILKHHRRLDDHLLKWLEDSGEIDNKEGWRITNIIKED